MGGSRNTELVSAAIRAALARRGVSPERQPRPWYFPTPAEYATLLERHGFEVRALWYFDRFTQLAQGARALAEWLTMFASPFTSELTPEDAAAFRTEVEEATRDALYVDGRWHVDYRRLRFVAVRT